MVGMICAPSFFSWTNAAPSGLWSMSTQSNAIRCSERNCLERLQSGHQGAPYTVISAIGRSSGDPPVASSPGGPSPVQSDPDGSLRELAVPTQKEYKHDG